MTDKIRNSRTLSLFERGWEELNEKLISAASRLASDSLFTASVGELARSFISDETRN